MSKNPTPKAHYMKFLNRRMSRKEFLVLGVIAISAIPVVDVVKDLLSSNPPSNPLSNPNPVSTPGGSTPLVILVCGGNLATPDAKIWETLASWGVGAIVYNIYANGIDYNFGGGTDKFSGSPTSSASYDTQRLIREYTEAAHQYGIKTLVGIPTGNLYWSSQTDTNPAPMLGSWDPSFTDEHGQTWNDWYQTMADMGDAIEWMGCDGIYFDNEDVRNDIEITWVWRYHGNGYGMTSSLARESRWAETAGATMMAAFNNGRTDLHAPNGKNYPVYCYMSSGSARIGDVPGGYLSYLSAYQGTEWKVYEYGSGTVTQSVESALLQSVYMYFIAGMASQTSGKIVLGDSIFYNYGSVVGGNTPFYKGTTQAQLTAAWDQALAYNANGFAKIDATVNAAPGAPGGFTMPSNVYITPMIWPADGSAQPPAGSEPNWNQSVWDGAKPAILEYAANSGGNTYLIFQFEGLTYGGITSPSLTINYADNTLADGANYTPLNRESGRTHRRQ